MANKGPAWEDEEKPLSPLKNNRLVCETCANNNGKTCSCTVFTTKPLSVLKGGACSEYK